MATNRTAAAKRFLAGLRQRGVAIELDGSLDRGALTADELETASQIGAEIIDGVLARLRQAARTSPKAAAAVPLDDATYEVLGFSKSAELGCWVHPLGDETGAAVLAAAARDWSSTKADAAERAARRQRQARGLGLQDPTMPPVEIIEAEQVGPGQFRWREKADTHARVFFKGRRIS